MTDLANNSRLLSHRRVARFFTVHLIGRIFSSPSFCLSFSLFSRRTICARISKNNYKSANGDDKNYLHAAAAEMPSARWSLHVLRPPLTSIAFILKTVRNYLRPSQSYRIAAAILRNSISLYSAQLIVADDENVTNYRKGFMNYYIVFTFLRRMC